MLIEVSDERAASIFRQEIHMCTYSKKYNLSFDSVQRTFSATEFCLSMTTNN